MKKLNKLSTFAATAIDHAHFSFRIKPNAATAQSAPPKRTISLITGKTNLETLIPSVIVSPPARPSAISDSMIGP